MTAPPQSGETALVIPNLCAAHAKVDIDDGEGGIDVQCFKGQPWLAWRHDMKSEASHPPFSFAEISLRRLR
ncbi:hypothetical protein [Erythrobacter sp.]|uniref:hypothetical protein n=1 Tax=Erythrobacter sp. TaxID=1042 RepID=UPI001B2E87EB|nr:hypothetical protein [Erythrobacter sp.]MBO6527536.1 hypothetical protein [Erythrobacter sp.]